MSFVKFWWALLLNVAVGGRGRVAASNNNKVLKQEDHHMELEEIIINKWEIINEIIIVWRLLILEIFDFNKSCTWLNMAHFDNLFSRCIEKQLNIDLITFFLGLCDLINSMFNCSMHVREWSKSY